MAFFLAQDLGCTRQIQQTPELPPMFVTEEQLYSNEPPIPSSQQQLQYFHASPPRFGVFQDSYSPGGVNTAMMTMMNCPPAPRFSPQASYQMPPAVQSTLSPSMLPTGFSYIPQPLPFSANPFEQHQETQQESFFAHGKRQRDENYRYSLSCISRRVKQWLDKTKPYAAAAQNNLQDSIIQDAINLSENIDETFLEMFDEQKKKMLCLTDAAHVSASHSESSISGTALATPTCMPGGAYGMHATMYPETFGVTTSLSEDLHTVPAPVEQEVLVKFPKQIPSISQTAGMKVHFDELTDRSVLRNWHCRTDEADLLARRGRKRFFKRVAVLPPDAWQPNKRPQAWEWAPSGPFALNLGEYVSISGTNGYPYEIVLIRHIQPAIRCFLSLVPAPRDLAQQMLNGEDRVPERSFIAHLPIDSVTHKWILNGFRPKDYICEMALIYINKDIEADRAQKEERKAKKGQTLTPLKSPIMSSTSVTSFSCSSIMTPTTEECCVRPTEESLIPVPVPYLL